MSAELQIKYKDEFGNEYVSCPSLKFRIDGKKRPGLLGVVCPDGVFWIHHIGVQDFFRNLFSWAKYVGTHPNCKEVPTSMSFRPCIKETEGRASYDRVYEFERDAVLSAMPLIVNTWNAYHRQDPALAAETGNIVREIATASMASHGDIKLGVNHLFLALMRFKVVAADMCGNFPEGIDFSQALFDAARLEEVLGALNASPATITEQLESRLAKGQSYELEPNLLIMFEPETQEFYEKLKKLTGGRDGATALEMLVAILMKPSREIAEALSDASISPAQLVDRAKKAARTDDNLARPWYRFW